jgi:hypothetical protein
MATKGVWVRDRQLALYAGLAFTLAGALLLRDAFEDRGQSRPWAMKLLGLVT